MSPRILNRLQISYNVFSFHLRPFFQNSSRRKFLSILTNFFFLQSLLERRAAEHSLQVINMPLVSVRRQGFGKYIERLFVYADLVDKCSPLLRSV